MGLQTKNEVSIQLPNGYKLVVETSTDPEFPCEVYVGVTDKDDVWIQNLAVVRSAYKFECGEMKPDNDNFSVLVYADPEYEDYTDDFYIGLRKDE